LLKNKLQYSDIGLSALLAIGVFYFCYSIYQKNESEKFLTQAQEKLKTIQNQIENKIENKIKEDPDSENNCLSFFKETLLECDIKIYQIKKQGNKIIAIIENNSSKIAQLTKLMDNLSITEKEDKILIEWNFEAPINLEEKKRAQFSLNSIIYINENNWQIWIDDKMYDETSKKISDNISIIKVTDSKVIIEKNNKTIELNL